MFFYRSHLVCRFSLSASHSVCLLSGGAFATGYGASEPSPSPPSQSSSSCHQQNFDYSSVYYSQSAAAAAANYYSQNPYLPSSGSFVPPSSSSNLTSAASVLSSASSSPTYHSPSVHAGPTGNVVLLPFNSLVLNSRHLIYTRTQLLHRIRLNRWPSQYFLQINCIIIGFTFALTLTLHLHVCLQFELRTDSTNLQYSHLDTHTPPAKGPLDLVANGIACPTNPGVKKGTALVLSLFLFLSLSLSLHNSIHP